MYKDRIEEYFNIHKDEMINDIFKLIRIKSDKGEAKEGMPFGEGPAKALEEALSIAASMGFTTKNYENYVGTVDFNEKEKVWKLCSTYVLFIHWIIPVYAYAYS